MINDIPR